MAEWELMFLVEPLSDDLEDLLCDDFDAVVGQHRVSERAGVDTIVSLGAAGVSASAAAKMIIAQLETHGVVVRRMYEDLVSRAMIAERAKVTTQAVGLWIRGERQGADFPAPFTHAGGGLWLWSEVNRWLGQLDLGDGMRHPDAVDYAEVNHWLHLVDEEARTV